MPHLRQVGSRYPQPASATRQFATWSLLPFQKPLPTIPSDKATHGSEESSEGCSSATTSQSPSLVSQRFRTAMSKPLLTYQPPPTKLADSVRSSMSEDGDTLLPYRRASKCSTQGDGKRTVLFLNAAPKQSPLSRPLRLIDRQQWTSMPTPPVQPTSLSISSLSSKQERQAKVPGSIGESTTADPFSAAAVATVPPPVPPRPPGFKASEVNLVDWTFPGDVEELMLPSLPNTIPCDGDATIGKWFKGKGKALNTGDEDEWERATRAMRSGKTL